MDLIPTPTQLATVKCQHKLLLTKFTFYKRNKYTNTHTQHIVLLAHLELWKMILSLSFILAHIFVVTMEYNVTNNWTINLTLISLAISNAQIYLHILSSSSINLKRQIGINIGIIVSFWIVFNTFMENTHETWSFSVANFLLLFISVDSLSAVLNVVKRNRSNTNMRKKRGKLDFFFLKKRKKNLTKFSAWNELNLIHRTIPETGSLRTWTCIIFFFFPLTFSRRSFYLLQLALVQQLIFTANLFCASMFSFIQ